jgi:hypothetical protein
MEGKLPEIYWYIFWIGVVIISFGAAYMAGRGGHQARMKALDILKMYAEKGAEPPPAMMEQLARQAFESSQPQTPKRQGRAALIQSFIGFVFMACVSYGFKMWLTDAEAPSWMIYAATGSYAFFGFGAFGFLLLALLTRDK